MGSTSVSSLMLHKRKRTFIQLPHNSARPTVGLGVAGSLCGTVGGGWKWQCTCEVIGIVRIRYMFMMCHISWLITRLEPLRSNFSRAAT